MPPLSLPETVKMNTPLCIIKFVKKIVMHGKGFPKRFSVPPSAGIEPATTRLRVVRSTD